MSAASTSGAWLASSSALDNPVATAIDTAALNASGKGNRTYSYLTAAQVTALGSPPGTELWYANPTPTPGVVQKLHECGQPRAVWMGLAIR